MKPCLRTRTLPQSIAKHRKAGTRNPRNPRESEAPDLPDLPDLEPGLRSPAFSCGLQDRFGFAVHWTQTKAKSRLCLSRLFLPALCSLTPLMSPLTSFMFLSSSRCFPPLRPVYPFEQRGSCESDESDESESESALQPRRRHGATGVGQHGHSPAPHLEGVAALRGASAPGLETKEKPTEKRKSKRVRLKTKVSFTEGA